MLNDKAFKCTVVNRALSHLHGESLFEVDIGTVYLIIYLFIIANKKFSFKFCVQVNFYIIND